MTKKQRHRHNIYKKAYKIIESGKAFYVCLLLDELMKYKYSIETILKIFEEFELFRPYNASITAGWWEFNDIDSRLNALAFCIAMTE